MGARGSHSQRIWITLDIRVPAEAAAWEIYQAMGTVMPDRARAELLRHIVVAGLDQFASSDVKERRANRAAANALSMTGPTPPRIRKRAIPASLPDLPVTTSPVEINKSVEIKPSNLLPVVQSKPKPEKIGGDKSGDNETDGFGLQMWDD